MSLHVEQLVAQLAVPSFGDILQAHLPFLKRYALRLTGNPHDGEDLVQDVLLKLYQQRERLLDVELLQPWLARVMYYHYIDLCRRRPAASMLVSLDQTLGSDEEGMEYGLHLADETPGAEAQLQEQELCAQVRQALQQLPRGVRELVRLHELEGLSLPLISERMGIPLNTIKSSLKRARGCLRRILRELQPQNGSLHALDTDALAEAEAEGCAA
jgi:RNA polymerase sigma factor (sigma-70 family)